VNLGGSPVTGIHVDEVYLLRKALELDKPGTPVKVIEPFQMLGELKPDVMEALGVDGVRLEGLTIAVRGNQFSSHFNSPREIQLGMKFVF